MTRNSRTLMCGSPWRCLIIIFSLLVASRRCNVAADSQILQKCHLKPFGCHKPPSETVKVVNTVPDPETFYRDYIQTSTPVLMKGGAAHWPAVQKWPGNEAYLVEEFGDEVLKVDYRKAWNNDFPKKKRMKIRDFLKIYREESVYLDSPVGVRSPFYKDMELPACLDCPDQAAKLTGFNMLYSSGNTSYVIHHDGQDNILTLVSGRKSVVVIDPKFSNHLYVNDFTVLPGLAPLEPEKIDLVKFPLVAEVDYAIAELEAGDMLYIPQMWFHTVKSKGDPNIAFSIWFTSFPQCDDRMEEEFDPDVMVVESTAVYLQCVKEQPPEISCKPGPPRSLSEIIESLPQETKEGWVQGYKSGDMKEVEPVPDKKMASGYTIPVLGLGTARMFQQTYEAVLYALKSGYRMIDTAQSYKYSEESIGRAIKDSGVPREDIFLITKLAPKFFGFSSTKNSVDVSLEKLGTDYVDLFLIHSPDCQEKADDNDDDDSFRCPKDNPKASWEESWKAMEELHKEGKIRSLGVSNFFPKHLKKLVSMAEVPVSVVQNWFDPFYRDEATREFCEQHGIVYQGYSTLGGMWTDWMYRKKTVERLKNPVLASPVLGKLSKILDIPVANIVLRWALQKGVVLIPKSTKEKHILSNLEVLQMELDELSFRVVEKKIAPVKINEDGQPSIYEDDDEWNRIIESADDGKHEEIQVQKDNKDQKRTNLFELVNLEDETIFIGSDDGKMYAFDGETGKVKWTFKTEEDLGSSPAFSPDRSVVYFGTEDGHVNALRATDGQVVWRYKTGGSVTCSPSVGADGTVYIGTLDNMMYAFTPDGAVKWSRDLGGEIWTHPALGHDGRLVYVGVMAETNFNAFALDSQTGTPAWSFKAAGPIWSAPILSQDGRYVYYSSRDSHVYTLRADSGSLVRKFDVGEDHDGVDSTPVINRDGTLFLATVGGSVMAVDIRRGKLRWEKMLGGEIMSSPVLDNDGYLYIGSGDGHLLKLKQKDGSVVWKFPAGEEVWSSPRLDKHGRVYIGSISGPVFCVDRETGRAVWSYETEGPVVATPQITTEHQYVYDYGQGTETKDEL
ncbi:AKR1B10 [Branchiostoma lanceolatum]|uniref:AKR1B10 protein n=1 Tax=Branchiostoma lanceolatum TaxID=7740 RepID=A0A8J9W6D6_BRALA|nr:AKR1B10 [Branchiostoma lanceolatum]